MDPNGAGTSRQKNGVSWAQSVGLHINVDAVKDTIYIHVSTHSHIKVVQVNNKVLFLQQIGYDQALFITSPVITFPASIKSPSFCTKSSFLENFETICIFIPSLDKKEMFSEMAYVKTWLFGGWKVPLGRSRPTGNWLCHIKWDALWVYLYIYVYIFIYVITVHLSPLSQWTYSAEGLQL